MGPRALKVLICPDKFKHSLTAAEAAAAIERGVRRAWPTATITVQPLADGGEGSLDILRRRFNLHPRRLSVTGPLRTPIEATYLVGDGTAYIESAAACGLHLVPGPRRHPKNTTTIGVGELIEDALARGAQRIYLFLGGSATNDCGVGMAAALGYRFLGPKGEDFVPMADSLSWVYRIDESMRHQALDEADIVAVCDVDNPLLGPSGATLTYAEQKGASPAELPALERQMAHLAGQIRGDLTIRVGSLPGGGAAGGLGAGAVAFLGAELRPGTEVLFETIDFDRLASDADLIVTGEGKIDAQTAHGKVIAGVVGRGRPTVAVCGLSEVEAESLSLEAVLAIMDHPGMTEDVAMHEAAREVESLVYDYLRGRERKL